MPAFKNDNYLLDYATDVLNLTVDDQAVTSHTLTIENIENSKSPTGFIPFADNSDKAKMTHNEFIQRYKFREYRQQLAQKRVIVSNLVNDQLAKIVSPCDSSRYFEMGRKKIRAKIFKRLGRWFNCPGVLVTLTFDPKKITREQAWAEVGKRRSEFLNRVNRWRKRAGYSKARSLAVLEVQTLHTGYPHVHIVFPYLRWLAPIGFMSVTWGMGVNAVDVKMRNSLSPVTYITKYVVKMGSWDDLSLSYMWLNRTRLYSLARDYSLPDWNEKRVAEWHFMSIMTQSELATRFVTLSMMYKDIIGGELYPHYGSLSPGLWRLGEQNSQGWTWHEN